MFKTKFILPLKLSLFLHFTQLMHIDYSPNQNKLISVIQKYCFFLFLNWKGKFIIIIWPMYRVVDNINTTKTILILMLWFQTSMFSNYNFTNIKKQEKLLIDKFSLFTTISKPRENLSVPLAQASAYCKAWRSFFRVLWQPFTTSIVYVSLPFERLVKINIEKESRLYCI